MTAMFLPLTSGEDVYALSRKDGEVLMFDAHSDAVRMLSRADIRRIMSVRWWNPFSWWKSAKAVIARTREYAKTANFVIAYGGGLATIESAFGRKDRKSKL